MRLAVISFTRAGAGWCRLLVRHFRKNGAECEGYILPRFLADDKAGQPEDGPKENAEGLFPLTESVGGWTGRQFGQKNGLIYIGAVGIAVRAVAPYLRDKLTDPAVVVMDEGGHYAISLLAGHVGGANALTRTVAGICGAEPVVTTATDGQGKTAIDVWASERELLMGDRRQARQVSASLLEEKPVGFFSGFAIEEELPDGYLYGLAGERNVWVTVKKQPVPEEHLLARLFEEDRLLRLIPRILTVGVGCRRGMAKEQIENLIRRTLENANLDRQAVACIASIDLKKDEEGICRLAEEWGVPFMTFPADVLERVKGSVLESAFVRRVTGCGNVCERAALAGAGAGGCLLVGRQAENGVTAAVAAGRWDGRKRIEWQQKDGTAGSRCRGDSDCG